MVVSRPTMLGQPIQVPAGMKGTCDRCFEEGRRGDGRLVTEGTEIADIEQETVFNGRYTNTTGRACVTLKCPDCGYPVQFALPGMRL